MIGRDIRRTGVLALMQLRYESTNMVAVAKKEMQDVLAQVATWPAGDRIVLARKILETVASESQRPQRGFSAEQVITQLNMPQPAPDDAACQRILEDELLRKHGE